jgi:Fe-S-cluster containining protein
VRPDGPDRSDGSDGSDRLRRQDTQLLQIVDAAFADSARRSGENLICRPGCTQCCHGAFAINALDALRLRSAMIELAATQPGQATAIEERTRRYLAEFGPSFPGDKTTGILGESDEAQAAFEDFANEAPCPVLNPETGLCDLYAARPMTCRVFGPPVRASSESPRNENLEEGFAVCELCFTEAAPEEIAAAEMLVPHAEEQRVLETLQSEQPTLGGETIIAYCLLAPPPVRPEPS